MIKLYQLSLNHMAYKVCLYEYFVKNSIEVNNFS